MGRHRSRLPWGGSGCAGQRASSSTTWFNDRMGSHALPVSRKNRASCWEPGVPGSGGPCPHGTYDVGEAVKPTVTIQCDRGQAAGLWRSEHIVRARSSDPGEAQGQFPRTAFYRPL